MLVILVSYKVRRLFCVFCNILYIEVDGYHILVLEDEHSMIPYAHVSDTCATPDEWKKILDLKEKLEKNEQILPEDSIINEDTPDFVCLTFEDRFMRAWLQLQEKVGKKLLGKLYDLELIQLDESEETQLILFCEFVYTPELAETEKGTLQWLKGTTFEILHNSYYNPVSYDMYLRAFRSELGDIQYVNACRHSMDEIVKYRSNDSEKQSQYFRKEESWLPMRWALRVLDWFIRAISEQTPMTFDVPTIQQAHAAIKPQPNLKTWDKVEEIVFDEIIDETSGAKKKKKLVVQRFDQIASSKQEDLELEKIICTVYDVDATLEDIIDIGALLIGPTKEELAEAMVQETFELALIDTLDEAELLAIQDKLNEVITVIESVQDLCDMTVFEYRLETSYQHLYEDRVKYQYGSIISSTSEKIAQEVKKALSTASDVDKSYDGIIRNMVHMVTSNLDKVEGMMEVIRSAHESIELCEYIHDLEVTLNKQEDALKSLDMVYNRVPLNSREHINLTHQQDRFITWNGDRSREEIEIDEELDFLRDTTENENEEADAEARISQFMDAQSKRMSQQDQTIKKKLRKHASKTPFGFQGFSLLDDEEIVTEVASLSPARSPRRMISFANESLSETSSVKNATPIKESTQERKSWFGYQTPDHLKRRAELMMTKKSWRMSDNRTDKHYNKYKNQENVTANLQNMTRMYMELKQRSSLMVDDRTVSNEEYERFVKSMEAEEEKRRAGLVKRNVAQTPQYSQKVGNRKLNKQLSAKDVSLFEMSGWRDQYNG
jgi:hypothetical protein